MLKKKYTNKSTVEEIYLLDNIYFLKSTCYCQQASLLREPPSHPAAAASADEKCSLEGNRGRRGRHAGRHAGELPNGGHSDNNNDDNNDDDDNNASDHHGRQAWTYFWMQNSHKLETLSNPNPKFFSIIFFLLEQFIQKVTILEAFYSKTTVGYGVVPDQFLLEFLLRVWTKMQTIKFLQVAA